MKKQAVLSVGKKKGNLLHLMWKKRDYYLLMVPFLALLVVFKYFPMYGLTLAFKEYRIADGIMGSPWAGFKYFTRLFKSYSFFDVLRNTLIISTLKILICFPVPIALAIFINEIRRDRVKKVFQTISYLPHFISWVIAASLIKEILSLDGPINYIIQWFGGEKIYFMADVHYFRGILIVTEIWKSCGWDSIVYLSAISGVDQELYEAARMDGASKWQEIWHVTIPGIRSTILILFILRVGRVLTAGFDQVFNLSTDAVLSVGDILDTYTYRQGIVNKNFSMATAAGLFQNTVGFVMVMISNFITNKLSDGEEGLW